MKRVKRVVKKGPLNEKLEEISGKVEFSESQGDKLYLKLKGVAGKLLLNNNTPPVIFVGDYLRGFYDKAYVRDVNEGRVIPIIGYELIRKKNILTKHIPEGCEGVYY